MFEIALGFFLLKILRGLKSKSLMSKIWLQIPKPLFFRLMRRFVRAKPSAQRIHQNNNAEPNQINHAQRNAAFCLWATLRKTAENKIRPLEALQKQHDEHQNVENVQMHDKIEQRHAPKNRHDAHNRLRNDLDKSEFEENNAQSHKRKEQWNGIFRCVEKRYDGKNGCWLRRPMRGIAIKIGQSNSDEQRQCRDAHFQKNTVPSLGGHFEPCSRRKAEKHNTQPRNRRISEDKNRLRRQRRDAKTEQCRQNQLRRRAIAQRQTRHKVVSKNDNQTDDAQRTRCYF